LIHFLVYNLAMIKVNIHEIKVHLSRYLREVEEGETILLCKRNVPVAEIRPLRSERRKERPLGLAKGKFKVPPEFFEPLPPELIESFEGRRG